jgi:ribA/ribD-fused uncharacterized protein
MIDRFIDEYRFLSNFYPCPIPVGDFLFPSVENAYQASKTIPMNGAMFEGIFPGQAKKLGNMVGVLRPDWEEVKVGIMEDLLRIKFAIPRLQEKLIATGDEELIEGNNWADRFWGMEFVNDGWVGENHLGKLLMKLREEYRNA